MLAASPNAAETWNNLGSLFLAGKRYADATTALTRAIAINPDMASAHNGLGVAYAAQGQTDKAIAEWQREHLNFGQTTPMPGHTTWLGLANSPSGRSLLSRRRGTKQEKPCRRCCRQG